MRKKYYNFSRAVSGEMSPVLSSGSQDRVKTGGRRHFLTVSEEEDFIYLVKYSAESTLSCVKS